MKRVRVIVTGLVQGVTYRAWTKRTALQLGLTGWVRNLGDGTVEAVFAGPHDQVDAMVERCKSGPRSARVSAVQVHPVVEQADVSGFELRETL